MIACPSYGWYAFNIFCLVYYFTSLYILLYGSKVQFLYAPTFSSFMVNSCIVPCKNPIILLVHVNHFLRRGYLLWEFTSILKNAACLSLVVKDKLMYFPENKPMEILAHRASSRHNGFLTWMMISTFLIR